MLAVLLGALFFLPLPGWLGVCALICAVAAWEWGGLAGWNSRARIAYAVVLGAIVLAIGGLRLGAVFVVLDAVAVAFWLLVAPLWLRRKWSLRPWSAVLTGFFVLVPATLVFVLLRGLFGPVALLAVAAIVWVADIAAYFSGRAFGGKKLAPAISPGKTWAGAIGAVVGVVIYGCVVLFLAHGASLYQVLSWVPVFVALTALSIVGDLFESLLKRQAGVKDSSNLLPGHGGVLDRVDSLTSTLPVVGLLAVGLLAYIV
jgi:phosphatidate cytidylyltransferase